MRSPAQVAVLGRAAANVHGLIARPHACCASASQLHGDGLHARRLAVAATRRADLAAVSVRIFLKHCALLRRIACARAACPRFIPKRFAGNRFSPDLQSESFEHFKPAAGNQKKTNATARKNEQHHHQQQHRRPPSPPAPHQTPPGTALPATHRHYQAILRTTAPQLENGSGQGVHRRLA